MPYGARPGSGPQALLTGPGRELGQRKCPWQDATPRGSSCAHGQCSPALGLTAPLAGWPKPGPRALLSPLPHCPVCGQALGFAPPLHPLFMPSSSNYGAPRMSRVHSRHWGWSSKQTHPAPRSFTRPPSKVPSTFRIRQTPKRAPNAVNCESELPSRDACPALTVDLLELIPSSKPLSTPATLPVAPVH